MVRSGDGTYFNGDIAEVGVWGRSLTDDEALILAAGMSPLAVSDGLVAYYPLFGRAGASGGEEDWVGGLALSAANSPIVTDHPRIIYPRRRSMIVVPAAASGPPTLTALTASMLTSTGGRLTVT